MKKLLPVFILSALGGFASPVYADDDGGTFNPVRDRLAERGELKGFRQDSATREMCGNYYRYHRATYGDEALKVKNLGSDKTDSLVQIYMCNAFGHPAFEPIVYDTAVLEEYRQDHRLTDEALLESLRYDVQEYIRGWCVKVAHLGMQQNQKELYEGFKPLCRAYDKPLP